MGQKKEPVSDFLISAGEKVRKYERSTIDGSKKTVKSLKSFTKDATERVQKFREEKEVDKKVSEAGKKLNEFGKNITKKFEELVEDDDEKDDASNLFNLKDKTKNKKKDFDESFNKNIDSLSNSIDKLLNDVNEKFHNVINAEKKFKEPADTEPADNASESDDLLDTLNRLNNAIADEFASSNDEDPLTAENVISFVKDQHDSKKHNVILFIFHGKGKTKLDAIARLAKEDGLNVLKVSTSTKVLSDGSTPVERAKDDLHLFLNGFRNYRPGERRSSLITVDARSGDNGIKENLNKVLSNSSERIAVIVLTDDDKFTESLKHFDNVERTF